MVERLQKQKLMSRHIDDMYSGRVWGPGAGHGRSIQREKGQGGWNFAQLYSRRVLEEGASTAGRAHFDVKSKKTKKKRGCGERKTKSWDVGGVRHILSRSRVHARSGGPRGGGDIRGASCEGEKGKGSAAIGIMAVSRTLLSTISWSQVNSTVIDTVSPWYSLLIGARGSWGRGRLGRANTRKGAKENRPHHARSSSDQGSVGMTCLGITGGGGSWVPTQNYRLRRGTVR